MYQTCRYAYGVFAYLYQYCCLHTSEEYSEFILKSNFSEDSIINFSNKIIIDSGIVVDRLQKDGHIPYEVFNNLKKEIYVSRLILKIFNIQI